ncbi:MAG: DUF488 domain-containing protein [Acidobacteriota bacterium]|jgi:uncharacterized protein YeaO (DUF488 family)
MAVAVKRVYEKPVRSDGARVLVDRLWPRGVRKEAVHTWLKDLAPSDELRRWFHARPQRWDLFRQRYLKELSGEQAAEALEQLYRLAETRSKLTLLFASRDLAHNNAIVLKQLLEGMRKPPTGTGPAAAAAMPGRQRARARRPR